MAQKLKVIFRWSAYNHYSLSAIFGFLDEMLDSASFEVMTGESLKDIADKIKNSDEPVVVGYSFSTQEFEGVRSEIKALKSAFGKKVVVICGGPHATALPQSVISCGADAAFIGESEESLPAYLKELRDNGFVREQVVNPLPLKDFDFYPPFSMKRKFIGPIELRRGCAGACAFCQTSQMFNRARQRSINFVKKYVEYMRNNERKRVLFTIPDVLSYGLKDNKTDLVFLEEFLKEIHSFGLHILLGNFPSEIFPGRLAENPQAAELLKKYVTNKNIIVGAQSGSDEVLKKMNRRHSVSDAEISVEVLSKAGFSPVADIMFGFPGETRSDRRATLLFMKKLSKLWRATFNVHYFMPLPGTKMADGKPEHIEPEIAEEVHKMIKTGMAHGDILKQHEFALKQGQRS